MIWIKAAGGDAEDTGIGIPPWADGPYPGLKPAGMDLSPAIPAADKALESGDPRPLLSLINEKVREGILKDYNEARGRRSYAKESVEAGRAYVQAYVPYLHFVERLYNDAVTPIAHGTGEGGHVGSLGHPEPHTH